LPAMAPAGAAPRGWLILSSGKGLGEALAERVRQRGDRALVAPPEDAFAGGLGRLLDAARAELPARWEVIHLGDLEAPAPEPAKIRADEPLAPGCDSALRLVRELARQPLPPRGPSVRLWLITRGGQAVETGEAPDAAQAALWGLGRVVAREHPALWGGLIDLPPAGPAAEAAALIEAQALCSDGEDQVAFRGGRRHVARLVAKDLAGPAREVPWRPDGAYLITGGWGGVGGLLGHWLAGQGAGHLILLGRRGLPVEGTQEAALMRSIASLGARVHPAQVDVADEAGLAAFLAGFRAAGGPPIRGVVHAAGVDHGGLAAEISSEELHAVLRPKIQGARVLERLLRDEPLDFFALFSSVGAFMGVPGQAGYAAANAALDAFAAALRARGTPALSIGWGAWEGVGMASRLSWIDRLRDLGVGTIPPQKALEVFGRLLRTDASHIAVLPIDWRVYGERMGAGAAPLFAPWIAGAGALAGSSRGALPAGSRPELMEYLQGMVSQVIGVPRHKLDPERSLSSLGIDSLMAVQLKNRIEVDLGAVLPMVSFLQGAGVAGLADRVLDQIAAAGDPTGTPEAESLGSEDPDALLARLETLSPEQVDALLGEMLASGESAP
jgi:phthiocerol/phenolphthiocerol synthesis type-I polyketide synthase D